MDSQAIGISLNERFGLQSSFSARIEGSHKIAIEASSFKKLFEGTLKAQVVCRQYLKLLISYINVYILKY